MSGFIDQPGKPSAPTFEPRAEEIVEEAGAKKIMPAVGELEDLKHMTVLNVATIGIKSTGGVILMDCKDPVQAAKARRDYGSDLQRMDRRLHKLSKDGTASQRKEASLVIIVRLLAALGVLCSREFGAPPAAAAAVSTGGPSTSYVTVQSEEDRGFMMHEYTSEDVKDAKTMLAKIFNVRVRTHMVGSMGTFKRVAYWIKMDGSVPDPTRVKLSSFRVLPTDSNFLLLRRLLMTIAVVAAGMIVPAGIRDEGAGRTSKFGDLWCNADVVTDLIGELDEVRDEITDEQMGVIASLIYVSLCAC